MQPVTCAARQLLMRRAAPVICLYPARTECSWGLQGAAEVRRQGRAREGAVLMLTLAADWRHCGGDSRYTSGACGAACGSSGARPRMPYLLRDNGTSFGDHGRRPPGSLRINPTELLRMSGILGRPGSILGSTLDRYRLGKPLAEQRTHRPRARGLSRK